MAAKLLLLLSLAATLMGPSAAQYSYTEPTDAANYDFSWTVSDAPSGNNYGHQEARQGDNTQGSYYVQLPDGRLQRVDYTVSGDSGFVAEVTYEGQAQYPQQQQGYGPAPSPSYGTPYRRPQQTYGPSGR